MAIRWGWANEAECDSCHFTEIVVKAEKSEVEALLMRYGWRTGGRLLCPRCAEQSPKHSEK